jgi:hypothetical protein
MGWRRCRLLTPLALLGDDGIGDSRMSVVEPQDLDGAEPAAGS